MNNNNPQKSADQLVVSENNQLPEITQTTPPKEEAAPEQQNFPVLNVRNEIMTAIVRSLKPIEHLEITEEEEKILAAPIPEDAIQILPHGQIYLPWSFYAERLNKAFGRTKWALIPVGDVKMRTSPSVSGALTVTREYIMTIKGCIVGMAYGEQDFFPKNPQMTEIEAIEATQSNALRRLVGKRLGVGLALWNQGFIRDWMSKYAVQEVNRKTGRLEWRKKTPQEIAQETQKEGKKASPQPQPPFPHLTKEEKLKLIMQNALKLGKNVVALREEMKQRFGVESTIDMTVEQVDEWLKSYLPEPETDKENTKEKTEE